MNPYFVPVLAIFGVGFLLIYVVSLWSFSNFTIGLLTFGVVLLLMIIAGTRR